MEKAKDRLVVALTAPIGGGIVIETKDSGYLHSEGIQGVREAVTNSFKVDLIIDKIKSPLIVDLKGISLIDGLLFVADKFHNTVICSVHRVPYIPQAAELVKMGFIGEDCYNRAMKLYESIYFHEWVPDYIRQLFFSTEVCGKLIITTQKDAEEFLPHCVKIIAYLDKSVKNDLYSKSLII